jgi:CubicO group peptidase (beta-lactamase class C family)
VRIEDGGGGVEDRAGLDAFIEARIRADRVPGLSVAVVEDDRVRWSRGFGVADAGRKTPAGPHTAYLWFSMTKIVTATAVMQLADHGRLDLDAAVNDYFPAFAMVRQPTPVNVRHLLSHSSGLANPIPLRWVHAADSPAPDPRVFVERLLARHRRLRFPPGDRASYSNLGYLVLGEVIAQVTGGSFEEYVRERVLAPLGMTHTGFSYDEIGEDAAAVGYQRLPAPFVPLLRGFLPHGVVGRRHGRYVGYRPFYVTGHAYGGLIGRVGDVARLAIAHLNHGSVDGARLLSPAATAAMQHVVPRGGARDFGLGWFRAHSVRTPTFVEHLGGGSGFFNVLRLYPDHRLGIVLMGNTTRYDHEKIIAAILDDRVRRVR